MRKECTQPLWNHRLRMFSLTGTFDRESADDGNLKIGVFPYRMQHNAFRRPSCTLGFSPITYAAQSCQETKV